jgi:hypothetical protein
MKGMMAFVWSNLDFLKPPPLSHRPWNAGVAFNPDFRSAFNSSPYFHSTTGQGDI